MTWGHQVESCHRWYRIVLYCIIAPRGCRISISRFGGAAPCSGEMFQYPPPPPFLYDSPLRCFSFLSSLEYNAPASQRKNSWDGVSKWSRATGRIVLYWMLADAAVCLSAGSEMLLQRRDITPYLAPRFLSGRNVSSGSSPARRRRWNTMPRHLSEGFREMASARRASYRIALYCIVFFLVVAAGYSGVLLQREDILLQYSPPLPPLPSVPVVSSGAPPPARRKML